MRIKLTTIQYDYLKSHLSNEEEGLFKLFNTGILDKSMFELDEDIAFTIRDWAGERLQRIGFDKDYKLTEDGQILEEIIDVLYK